MIADLLRDYANHAAARRSGEYTPLAKAKDFMDTFGSEHGRRVLLELMVIANWFPPVLAENPDARAVAEGQRAVIYDIMRQLTAEPQPETKTVNYRI